MAVVRCSRNNSDAALKIVEFHDAAFPAHAGYLVASIQCVLYHVLPELPGCPHDANLLHIHPLASSGHADMLELYKKCWNVG
jgi:hypothetical protein